jgi:hypothetical protein
VLLQEQPVVVLLLEETLISWSLAIDECGGYEDLRGSGHRSVIPYVHRIDRNFESTEYHHGRKLSQLSDGP